MTGPQEIARWAERLGITLDDTTSIVSRVALGLSNAEISRSLDAVMRWSGGTWIAFAATTPEPTYGRVHSDTTAIEFERNPGERMTEGEQIILNGSELIVEVDDSISSDLLQLDWTRLQHITGVGWWWFYQNVVSQDLSRAEAYAAADSVHPGSATDDWSAADHDAALQLAVLGQVLYA